MEQIITECWGFFEHGLRTVIILPMQTIYFKTWWGGANSAAICERLSRGVAAHHWQSSDSAKEQCLLMIDRDLDSVLAASTVVIAAALVWSFVREIGRMGCSLWRRACRRRCGCSIRRTSTANSSFDIGAFSATAAANAITHALLERNQEIRVRTARNQTTFAPVTFQTVQTLPTSRDAGQFANVVHCSRRGHRNRRPD